MRCFIAIDIPEEIKEKIMAIEKELEEKIKESAKFVERENLHITLKFLGEIEENKIPEIKEIINSISFTPFKIKLKGIGVFPNEKFIRVIWIGGESKELEGIASYLDEKLKSIGKFESEEFTIHLTIARVKSKINISNFLNKYQNYEFGEFEVANINQIKLKKSTLTPKGPIYEDL
jgi:2'-5' RNA ligase